MTIKLTKQEKDKKTKQEKQGRVALNV